MFKWKLLFLLFLFKFGEERQREERRIGGRRRRMAQRKAKRRPNRMVKRRTWKRKKTQRKKRTGSHRRTNKGEFWNNFKFEFRLLGKR